MNRFSREITRGSNITQILHALNNEKFLVSNNIIWMQSSHATVKALKVTLQVAAVPSTLVEGFLWPRVFVAGAVVVVGYWDLRRLVRPSACTGLYADHLAEAADFVQNHLLHLWNLLDDLKLEIKRCWAGRLVGGVVPDL